MEVSVGDGEGGVEAIVPKGSKSQGINEEESSMTGQRGLEEFRNMTVSLFGHPSIYNWSGYWPPILKINLVHAAVVVLFQSGVVVWPQREPGL